MALPVPSSGSTPTCRCPATPTRATPASTSTPARTPPSPAGGGRALVPTGIAVAIPPGHAGFVLPAQRARPAPRHRASSTHRASIDAAYRGELQVVLLNTDPDRDYTVHRGDRIAQLVVQRVEEVAWHVVDALDGVDRGGGFGHSGRGSDAPLLPGEDGLLERLRPESSRPSRASQRNCTSTAAVGAWIRSRPSGTCTTGRSLSGMSTNRGESVAQQLVQPDPVRGAAPRRGAGAARVRPPPHSTTGVMT